MAKIGRTSLRSSALSGQRVGAKPQKLCGEQMNVTKQKSACDLAYLTGCRLCQTAPAGYFTNPLAENCGLKTGV